MQRLTLRKQCKCNTTIIENEFIDTYMPKANGEHVKVYLYLLRHLNAHDSSITLTDMIDCLDSTERDVLRALTYWEQEGLLLIAYDASQNICGVDIASISANNVAPAPNPQPTTIETRTETPIVPVQPVAVEAPLEVDEPIIKSTNTASRKEFRQLLFMTEQYLGKVLSRTDIDTISYFYDSLNFSIPLIEFLVEYCIENGHCSMHYIKSVAVAWSKANITTIDKAKAQIANFNKDYYTVLKAFGITGRHPVASEKQFVDRWTKEQGFSMELILEACARTIANIHQPSFEYADSILNSWNAKKVHYLSDLEKIDQEYQNSKKKKVASEKANTSKNSFNNFQQRSYDIDSLEKKLLNVQ